MKTNPVISVIIPIYNVSAYINGCLDSCINQTYKNLEIICVNDGSTDNCLEIVEGYADQDNRIKIVDKPNGGLPSARKAGIEVASGDYIFHLDGDDSLPLDAIENLLSALESAPEADIVIGDYFMVYDDGTKVLVDTGIDSPLDNLGYRRYILNRGLFNIWGRLIRKSLYDDNDISIPLNISMAEDLVQTFQLAHYARKTVACHKPCYNYYIRKTSMSATNVIGSLTDRSIYAVEFISDFAESKKAYEISDEMSAYLCNFIYTYLCSPHTISKRGDTLKKLVKRIDKKSIAECSSWFKRFVLSTSMHNLHLAKSIVSMAKAVKKL